MLHCYSACAWSSPWPPAAKPARPPLRPPSLTGPANLSNELQVTLTDNIQAAVEGLGAEFLSSDPQGDPVTQVTQVENFISRGVDMILMSPNDASACGVVLQEAVEAGIPMIIVNCKMDDMDGALCYVGCDDLSC